MPNRQNALHNWLDHILEGASFSLTPLAGDASFRQYLRLHYGNTSRIVMDAPPEKEPVDAFVAVASLLRKHSIAAPQVHALNSEKGFIVLDDYGDEIFLNALSASNANALYQSAINTLISLQNIPIETARFLPEFDKAHAIREMSLFPQWFLDAYLGLKLTDQDLQIIHQAFEFLSQEQSLQPKVIIHRDYHSRNIMILDKHANPVDIGLLDFQDAMIGPLTYDLVSLLKDCYVQWPQEKIAQWTNYFYQHSSLAKHYSLASFTRAFDLCGLQRHLKVLGIFSRLWLRDGKQGYLKDLPLTLDYVMASLESYDELRPLYQLMQQKVRLP